MKLYYSTTSPYSRKARLAVLFKQLEDQVTQIACNPFADAPDESHHNPLGKVPTLILNDGITIFDSPVICEYLDGMSQRTTLYPKDRPEWIRVKTTEALGDGILDAAYNIVMERRRIDQEQSATAIDQWKTEIDRSLKQAENIISTLNGDVTQAHIAMYCTLGYLDFRLPDMDWRKNFPSTMPQWYDEFQEKYPFTIDTRPQ